MTGTFGPTRGGGGRSDPGTAESTEGLATSCIPDSGEMTVRAPTAACTLGGGGGFREAASLASPGEGEAIFCVGVASGSSSSEKSTSTEPRLSRGGGVPGAGAASTASSAVTLMSASEVRGSEDVSSCGAPGWARIKVTSSSGGGAGDEIGRGGTEGFFGGGSTEGDVFICERGGGGGGRCEGARTGAGSGARATSPGRSSITMRLANIKEPVATGELFAWTPSSFDRLAPPEDSSVTKSSGGGSRWGTRSSGILIASRARDRVLGSAENPDDSGDVSALLAPGRGASTATPGTTLGATTALEVASLLIFFGPGRGPVSSKPPSATEPMEPQNHPRCYDDRSHQVNVATIAATRHRVFEQARSPGSGLQAILKPLPHARRLR